MHRFLFDLSFRTKDDHLKHQLLYFFLLGSTKLFRSIYRQGIMPRLMSVWISMGYYNKYIIIWVMYKQQEFISHGSEDRNSKSSMVRFSVKTLFLVCRLPTSSCIFPCAEGWLALWPLLINVLIPLLRALPHELISSQRSPPPSTITLGEGF